MVTFLFYRKFWGVAFYLLMMCQTGFKFSVLII